MFADSSDPSVLIAQILFGSLTTLGLAWIGYLTLKVKQGQQAAEVKADAVAVKVDKVADVAAVAARKADTVAVKAAAAAVQVSEVKATLAESTASVNDQLATIAQVGRDTHTLVNSAMGRQLELTAATARALAAAEPGPVNEAAATTAERLLLEHRRKQAVVDKGEKT